jgi:hypothetical protein
MNRILKTAVGAALAAASTGAFAMTAVESGSSDLVLWVQADNSSGTVLGTYAFDTGLTISSIFGTTFTSGANLVTLPGVSQTFSTIGAGSTETLASFLSTYNTGSNTIQWALEGGFYTTTGAGATNGNTATQGAAEAIFTSTLAGASTPNGVTGLTNGSLEQLLNGFANTGASPPSGAGGVDSLVSLTANASGTTTAATWTNTDQAKFGIFSNGTSSDAIVGVGPATEALYGVTGNNPTSHIGSAILQSYLFGTASLSAAGVLTLVGNATSTVPLPGAVWLLGSGLFGLLGVSRRRKANGSAAS